MTDTAPVRDADEATAAAPNDRAFPRRMRGYDRRTVDATIATLDEHVLQLREAVMEQGTTIGELEQQLTRSRQELRYWHDREAYIDTELDRARTEATRLVEVATERGHAIEAAAFERATQLEQEACDRTNQLEQDAQERSLAMVDRVCDEANAILQHARDEAHALVARYDDDVDLSQRRIERMTSMQQDITHSMRSAIGRFEDGMRELELVTPSALAAHHPTPTRRPTASRIAADVAADEAVAGMAQQTMSATTSTAIDAPITSVETIDASARVTLGQSATAGAVSAATTLTDPAVETMRMLSEGAPLR